MASASLTPSALQRQSTESTQSADEPEDVLEATLRLRSGAAATSRPSPARTENREPRQIGDYRIVREIGRGGMGVVYEAEQISLGRRVALKVLSPHILSDPQALERFRREARSAARLHHTNIIPVYEVGRDGDIWFYAMQFIAGQSLSQAIAAGNLTPGSGTTDHYRYVARLGSQVADALAYAHERDVVHRDIKPANLLLDAAGAVWIADFGLAKGTSDNVTQPGDLVGTLAYMAPERFRGQGDARADVYALGLTLYELALGKPAFCAIDHVEIMRLVQHAEPDRPRHIDPRLPRDLETIILKAMDKEPARRYPSAGELAADLNRFLADEPIHARRSGPLERLWRSARRNPRLALLTTAVVALGITLVVGAIASALSFRHLAEQERLQAQAAREAETQARVARELAEAETERANRETETAQEIAVFLMGLLEESDPLAFSGGGLGLRKLGDPRLTPLEMLDQASAKLKTALLDRPAVRARLLDKLGAVYTSFGKFDVAGPHLEEALALRQKLFSGDHADLAESWQHMGYYHHARRQLTPARACYEQALAIRQRLWGDDHPLTGETLLHLGFLHAANAKSPVAEPMLRKALDIHARHCGKKSREYGLTLVALVQWHYLRHEPDKMLPLLAEGKDLVEGLAGQKPAAALQEFLQGQVARRLGMHEQAGAHYRTALALGEPWLGETHFFMLMARLDLAALYHNELKDKKRAEEEYRLILSLLAKCHLDESGEAANTRMHLGRILRDQKRYDEAEPLLVKAAEHMRAHEGDLGRCLHILGEVRFLAKDYESARAALAEAVAVRKTRSREDKYWYSRALDAYVQVLLRQDKNPDAAAALREHVPELDLHDKPDAAYHFRQASRRGLLCSLLADQPAHADFVAATRDQAIASLRQARAGGFDVATLKNPALQALSEHPDFAALVSKATKKK